MTKEYGVLFKGRVIRERFSKGQAESFMRAKEGARDFLQYKIVYREIGDWI